MRTHFERKHPGLKPRVITSWDDHRSATLESKVKLARNLPHNASALVKSIQQSFSALQLPKTQIVQRKLVVTHEQATYVRPPCNVVDRKSIAVTTSARHLSVMPSTPIFVDDGNVIPPSYFQALERDEQFQLAVTGGRFGKPDPIREFSECDLDETVLENVRKAGYIRATPIQSRAIPAILAGEDLMALAQTGLGKTAAFLLPLITLIMRNEDMGGGAPLALILTATHELAFQIFQQANKFANGTGVEVVVVQGGDTVEDYVNGYHIVIGTLGRLVSLLDDGQLDLGNLEYLVIDEADRMLYTDFRKNTDYLLNHISMPGVAERQTLLFSATFAKDDQKRARSFLDQKSMLIHPPNIGIPNPKIQQVVVDLEAQATAVKQMSGRGQIRFDRKEMWSDRDWLLCYTLRTVPLDRKILVFVETRADSRKVNKKLNDNGMRAGPINSDMSNAERESSLRQFVNGTVRVLVATDLAARGLHIPHVDHVINYDLPRGDRSRAREQYVNRIGRTGRAGQSGKATSFYDKSQDSHMAMDLVKCIADVEQECPDWLQREAGVLGRSLDWE